MPPKLQVFRLADWLDDSDPPDERWRQELAAYQKWLAARQEWTNAAAVE